MLRRNRAIIAFAIVSVLASAGPVAAAAAVKFVLGGINTAATTTTIQTAGSGSVLALQNSGTGAGLNVTVPAGQPPITVSAGAGTATNLDADRLDGHEASDFVQGPEEGWHLIGTAGEPAWGRPTLTSIDPFLPTGFLKDPFGFVHLQGHVLAATDQTDGCDTYALFTLPAGDRPAADATYSAIAGVGALPTEDTVARVDILPNGNVELCYPRLITYGWVALDGISFQAGP